MKVGNYSFVKPNTLEKSRGRKSKDLFSNKSSLCFSKSKGTSKHTSSIKKTCRACITCRDLHNQPVHISQGHRSGSTKCPYYKKPSPSSLVQKNVIGNNLTQEIGEDTKFVDTPAGATTYSYPSL